MIRHQFERDKAMVVIGWMILPVLTGIVLSGCVPFPTVWEGGVGAITAWTIESFEPGKTTRADVLLRLGDPAKRLEDDRFFVYTWTRIQGFTATPPLVVHHLGLEFTPDDRLKRARVIDRWRPWDSGKVIDRWRLWDSGHDLEKWLAEQPESPNQ